jgi:hypothetical protein
MVVLLLCGFSMRVFLEQDETVTNSYGNSFRTAGGAKFPQD